MTSALLTVEGLCKVFGGVVAVHDASFTIQPEQIKALIGPNGAGKSTVLNMISGVLAPTKGRILLNGHPIHGLPAHQVAARGIARTFQTVELFTNMNVVENVMVGRHLRSHGGFFSAMTRLGRTAATERIVYESAMHWLDLLGLADYAQEHAGDLSFGHQRLLEMARALAAAPQLLLLDEAASGLSTEEKHDLVNVIYRIRETGVTIFMVDHDMDLVMGLSDEVVVLDHGVKIAEGAPDAVQRDAQVIAAYLGEEMVHA